MQGFQTIGSIAVLKSQPKEQARKEAREILAKLPRIESVYMRSGPISGPLRRPRVSWLAGEKNPVTVHKENGCLYKLDIQKIMFSKGNVSERGRIPELVNPGETITDMFAGIGYFSLPIGKSRAGKIHSIELNPESFRFLKENIRLNKLEGKVIPIKGDCRKVKVPEKADRIIMGYFPGTQKFLQAAFRLLNEKGIIHYHDTFSKDELWEKPESLLKDYAEKSGFTLRRILNTKVVKQISPRVYHVVIDAEFRRKSPQV